MLLETGMSNLLNITASTAENMSEAAIIHTRNTYRDDLESVAIVCAMNVHNGNVDAANAGAAEAHRLNVCIDVLRDESSIRRTNEKSIAALIAELAKGNPA